ncbi:hypothetical protein RISW2_21805 [Roseivivax isoporae LMG 25204]|uniref:Uncharacterized protein n=1 Tax=Roseivivax isoporae LMG 25204 TaxID=1449351 RepID=X7F1G5_9RHOB|nr:hypothetical protein RISW2_21805 [Roseivivax isoporae LMG 25204]
MKIGITKAAFAAALFRVSAAHQAAAARIEKAFTR